MNFGQNTDKFKSGFGKNGSTITRANMGKAPSRASKPKNWNGYNSVGSTTKAAASIKSPQAAHDTAAEEEEMTGAPLQ